jgi:hypothetical protein
MDERKHCNSDIFLFSCDLALCSFHSFLHAAYYGIFRLWVSHGLVSVENVVSMSQMFDTVGR